MSRQTGPASLGADLPDQGEAPVALIERGPGEALFLAAHPSGIGPAQPITAARFLHDVTALAARLPDAPFAANLCRDRYAFTVAFAAALVRGQPNLLLSDRSAAALAALAARFPGAYALTDDPAEPLPDGMAGHAASPGLGGADGRDGVRAPPPVPTLPAGQVAAIVFTSGSTGAPVGHTKRWGELAARSRAAGERFGFGQGGDEGPAAVVATVPPHHMYGFETSVLLPLHAPAAVWCGPSFYPGDVRAALGAVAAPRVLVTTPLHMRALLGADGPGDGTALPPLLCAVSATAPLDPGLAAEAEARWTAPVLEIFGATEVGSVASRRTLDGELWHAYPSVRLRPAPDGTAVVEAPGAEPTSLADEVEFLPSGPFRLVGRRADLVKMGGRRASLAGLGRILAGLDGVEDAAFVAPDDLGHRPGARLLAFVVAPERSMESLVAELRTLVDPVFLPRRLIRVDRLPRNELGKLPRQALLALLASGSAGAHPGEAA